MRELTIAQNILNTAIATANSRQILNVNLQIGSFSEEREESIRFYWRDLAKGTPGEGATLHFHRLKADMNCFGCGGTLGFDEEGSICAFCQTRDSALQNGEDVQLESIEVE